MKAGFCLLLFLQFAVLSAQKTGTIDLRETLLHYQTFGEGPPVLIINGGPGMSSEGFVPL